MQLKLIGYPECGMVKGPGPSKRRRAIHRKIRRRDVWKSHFPYYAAKSFR